MKKILSLVMLSCITLCSLASPWDVKATHKHINVSPWDKPLMSEKAKPVLFEDIAILDAYPMHFDADYWYVGQPAGYYLVLNLEGKHEATWELSIDIQISGGVSAMKTFVFIVPPCGAYYHTHILEMEPQMSSGESIPSNALTGVNHWWIIS